jgi:hypothetical protein
MQHISLVNGLEPAGLHQHLALSFCALFNMVTYTDVCPFLSEHRSLRAMANFGWPDALLKTSES